MPRVTKREPRWRVSVTNKSGAGKTKIYVFSDVDEWVAQKIASRKLYSKSIFGGLGFRKCQKGSLVWGDVVVDHATKI